MFIQERENYRFPETESILSNRSLSSLPRLSRLRERQSVKQTKTAIEFSIAATGSRFIRELSAQG